MKSQEVLIRPVKVYSKGANKQNEEIYKFETNIPSQGWLAFWFEAKFVLNDGEFVVSSDTFVAPENKFLSEECLGEEECKGSLV